MAADVRASSLEETQRQLQILLDQLPAALWTTDRDLRFTSFRGTALERVGLRPLQAPGTTLFDFFQTRDRNFQPIHAHFLALDGQSLTFEQTWRGQTFRVRVEPLRDLQGENVGALGLAIDISETKQTEAALRESELRLRQVLDLVPHMIFAKDEEGRLLLVNRTLAEAYGTSVEQLTGRYHQDVHQIPGELRHYLQDDLEVIRTGQSKFIPEETFVDAEGQTRWLQTTKIPLPAASGSERAMLGIAVDITELKKSQQALEDIRRHARLLADAAQVGILVADAQGQIISANRYWSELTGMTQDQSLCEGWLTAVDASVRDQVSAAWRASVNAGSTWSGKFSLAARDRGMTSVQARSIVERSEQGQPTGFIVTISDRARSPVEQEESTGAQTSAAITAAPADAFASDVECRREVALDNRGPQRDAEFHAHIFDMAPTLIVALSPEGITHTVNPAVKHILGYSAEEVIGQDWWRLVYPGDSYRQVEQLYRDFRQGAVTNYDMVATASDGTQRVISWNSVNRYSADGSIREIIGIGMDVTERREMERNLRERQQVLRQMLDAYERDRRLLSMEMHDGLIQQMTGALMHLQSANLKVETAPQRAREQLTHCVEMFRECIAEARRLMSGLRPPVLDEEGVVAALEFLVAELGKDLEEVHFENNTRFERLAAPLENTLFRIAQEAMNNIRRHSQARRATITLAERDHEISLAVTDDGRGFNLATVAPDRFGLKGIRERAELLGGAAEIRSTIGVGTTLTVRLPKIDVLE